MITRAVAPAPAGAAVETLIELGVLDQLDASWSRTEDLSRAHPVWRVVVGDGRRLVVKAGIGHGGPDLAVECLVYRMTWWCPPLAAALPVPLVVDEDRQLLVLSDVSDPDGPGSLAQRVGFPGLLTGGPPSSGALDPDIATVLGRTVGSVHRGTAGFPLPPAPPPLVLSLLGIAAAPATEDHGLGPRVRAVAETLAALPAVTGAVTMLRRPVAGCLVNHDLKWDNIVLAAGSSVPDPVLLDWELAGLGDPAWDLGCLLAEHLVRAATPVLDDGARALLGGYREGARPRAGIVPVFAHRVAAAAGLRIAQLGLEVAYTPYSADDAATARLVDRAVAVLSDDSLTEEVCRCLR